jgi:hypothetical protein
MWTIETPWFDVAVLMTLFAIGSILFGHLEQYKPAWRRLLKVAIILAVLITLEQTVGRSWAYGVLALLFTSGGSYHFWWLSKHGINGWTGEPRDKYLALVGRPHNRDRAIRARAIHGRLLFSRCDHATEQDEPIRGVVPWRANDGNHLVELQIL